MTDPFTDRIAELAGQTNQTLKQVADALDASGLISQAATLRNIAEQHKQVAHDCLTETQPINISRHNLTVRIQISIEEIEVISAELLAQGKQGHNELSDAALLLQDAIEKQDK